MPSLFDICTYCVAHDFSLPAFLIYYNIWCNTYHMCRYVSTIDVILLHVLWTVMRSIRSYSKRNHSWIDIHSWIEFPGEKAMGSHLDMDVLYNKYINSNLLSPLILCLFSHSHIRFLRNWSKQGSTGASDIFLRVDEALARSWWNILEGLLSLLSFFHPHCSKC